MKVAEIGKQVEIQYSITLDDGSVVGNPNEKTDLKFRMGGAQVLPKLEEQLLGMSVGEVKKIEIGPKDGYGEYNKDIVIRVERSNFPPDLELQIGKTVQYQNRDGERVNFIVNALDEQTVTIDGNHPLAGLNLIYEVELKNVL